MKSLFNYLKKSVPGVNSKYNQSNEAGFLAGLYHGVIIQITFIVSLFNANIGIYETNNNGWKYNLGYIIGFAAGSPIKVMIKLKK